VSNPATTNASGQIAIDLTATDAGGDRVRRSVVSRRGSDPVVSRLTEEFPQANSRRYAATLTFTGEGTHVLQASARDSAGHEAISLWHIVVPPAGGGGPGPAPTFSPPSGEFWDVLYVTITAAPGHNVIAYKVTDPQSTQPAVFASHAGTTLVVKVSGTKYVWAASGNGLPTTSPVVFASYKFLGIFGS